MMRMRTKSITLGLAACTALVLGSTVLFSTALLSTTSNRTEAPVAHALQITVDKPLDKAPNKRSRSKTVRAALDWLVRHQKKDGSWSCDNYITDCADPKKPCQHQHPAYTDGRGFTGYDPGVTALALWAFVSAGHTHTGGNAKYRPTVLAAKSYLVGQQTKSEEPKTNGFLGHTTAEEAIYNHAIATVALGELLYKSKDPDPEFRACVERAVAYCLEARNDGYAWKYDFRSGKNDTSVTGWMVRAIVVGEKCAKRKFITIDPAKVAEAKKGAVSWLNRVTSAKSGITGYQSPGDPGASLRAAYPEPYPYSKDPSAMTAAAVACHLACGADRGDTALQQSASYLVRELPEWKLAKGKRQSKVNLYYWYYGTHALEQFGGKPWKAWRSAIKQALVPSQCVGGCEDGSWDPIGEWGAAGGRVYSTAMSVIVLEGV